MRNVINRNTSFKLNQEEVEEVKKEKKNEFRKRLKPDRKFLSCVAATFYILYIFIALTKYFSPSQKLTFFIAKISCKISSFFFCKKIKFA